MKTVTLHDGRELTVDLYKVTLAEWRSVFTEGQPQEQEDEIVARALGLSPEELLALPQPDSRRVYQAFIMAGRDPLEDPNSQGASTKDSPDKATESQTPTTDGS